MGMSGPSESESEVGLDTSWDKLQQNILLDVSWDEPNQMQDWQTLPRNWMAWVEMLQLWEYPNLFPGVWDRV